MKVWGTFRWSHCIGPFGIYFPAGWTEILNILTILIILPLSLHLMWNRSRNWVLSRKCFLGQTFPLTSLIMLSSCTWLIRCTEIAVTFPYWKEITSMCPVPDYCKYWSELISIACDMSDLPATLQMTRALRTQPFRYKMTLDKDNYNDPLHVS